jgi:hypothetical protein
METCHLLVNLKYKELWGKSYTIKPDCLAHSIPGISKGTKTIVFIGQEEVLINQSKNIKYRRVCVNYGPEKTDPNRTCLTVGGNHFNYPGGCDTPIIDMVTVKIHLNSVISTKSAQYSTIDLKDFYLNTLMVCPEIMHMKLAELPKYFA